MDPAQQAVRSLDGDSEVGIMLTQGGSLFCHARVGALSIELECMEARRMRSVVGSVVLPWRRQMAREISVSRRNNDK